MTHCSKNLELRRWAIHVDFWVKLEIDSCRINCLIHKNYQKFFSSSWFIMTAKMLILQKMKISGVKGQIFQFLSHLSKVTFYALSDGKNGFSIQWLCNTFLKKWLNSAIRRLSSNFQISHGTTKSRASKARENQPTERVWFSWFNFRRIHVSRSTSDRQLGF